MASHQLRGNICKLLIRKKIVYSKFIKNSQNSTGKKSNQLKIDNKLNTVYQRGYKDSM